MQNEIGIMQGRLSPRVNGEYQAFPENWTKEFELAEAFGFKYIEYHGFHIFTHRNTISNLQQSRSQVKIDDHITETLHTDPPRSCILCDQERSEWFLRSINTFFGSNWLHRADRQ